MHMRRPMKIHSLCICNVGRGYGFCFCRKIVLFCSHQSRSQEVRLMISDFAGPISFFLLMASFNSFIMHYLIQFTICLPKLINKMIKIKAAPVLCVSTKWWLLTYYLFLYSFKYCLQKKKKLVNCIEYMK